MPGGKYQTIVRMQRIDFRRIERVEQVRGQALASQILFVDGTVHSFRPVFLLADIDSQYAIILSLHLFLLYDV